MTKGRKTTYNERVEIVAFCIENNDNYQLIVNEGFKCSTQDNDWLGEGVYFWDEISNAYWWANNAKRDISKEKCIIVCELNCPINKYLELDVEMKMFVDFLTDYENKMKKYNGSKPVFKSNDMRKKFYCDVYCSQNKISILAHTFEYPKNKFGFKIGTILRRQVCVRDPNLITIQRKKVI